MRSFLSSTMAVVAPPPPLPIQDASLYVGDLDPQVSESELLEAFSGVSGPIASVRLCRDSISGQSLRYAYVNYYSSSEASKAMDFLNHTCLNGKPMRIMRSKRDPLLRKTGIANLFVKNLDLALNSAGLQDIFSKFGTLLSCKVPEENGKSKGFGFAQFVSEESAVAAIKALHGTLLHGKELYVSKFVKKYERQTVCKEPKFTNLYVKNLDRDLTENLLRDKFSDFGKVSNVAIIKDGQGKSKGFGFINFESPEDAKKAVEFMNDAQLGSKKIFAGRAQKKAEREQLLRHQYKEIHDEHIQKLKDSNVYVKNLDVSIDDNILREHFNTCGQITSAKVMRYDNGISKGFGFVCFSTPDEAKKAVTIHHGTTFQERCLYVAIAQRKQDRHAKLQLRYAQHTLRSLPSSVPELVVPQGFQSSHYYLPPSHINPCQSVLYHHADMNSGILPPEIQGYRTMFPPVISREQTQQGRTNEWVNELPLVHAPYVPYFHRGVPPLNVLQGFEQQNSTKYSTASNLYRQLGSGALDNQKLRFSNKMGNMRSGTGDSSSQGSGVNRNLIAATAPGNCKQLIGNSLHPLVQKLQL